MKLTGIQMERMVRRIFEELKKQNAVEFKETEEKVARRAVALVKENFDAETALEREAHRMLDQLEAQNPGGFNRHKMFPMLKKRLAQEKGFVL